MNIGSTSYVSRGFESQRTCGGFSLVEVVIALAVVAVCSIVMIGLLGVGLTTFNTSEQLTVSGKIKEQIVGDLEQAGWAGVLQQYFGISSTSVNAGTTWVGAGANPVSQKLEYDEYGNPLTDSSGNLLPAATATPIFQAMVTPVTTSGGDGPASSPSLIEFQIQISRVGVPNPATAPGTTTYTAFVAHN